MSTFVKGSGIAVWDTLAQQSIGSLVALIVISIPASVCQGEHSILQAEFSYQR
jgi:hypothetical protein